MGVFSGGLHVKAPLPNCVSVALHGCMNAFDGVFMVCCCYSYREEPTFKVIPKAEETVPAEDMYSAIKPKAPYFTKQPTAVGVKEGHPVRFECTLLPVGDPNMSVEWYFNGQLVKVGEYSV